ncbi:hypothetical protein ABZW49_45800 [Nonomuraea wenchangensis]
MSPLFDWYGDVEVPMVGYPITFRVAAAGVGCLREQMDFARYGALVCGRRVFDCIGGWGGDPPGGGRASVVTHRKPPASWPAERASALHARPRRRLRPRHRPAVSQPRPAGRGPDRPGSRVPRRRNPLFDNTQIEKAELERVEGEGVTHLHYR